MSRDTKWLLNAEVKSKVEYIGGRWEVSLLFIDTKNPIRVLVRKINTYQSQKLANIAANYMRQTAEKDFRGTQKVKKNAFNINLN